MAQEEFKQLIKQLRYQVAYKKNLVYIIKKARQKL